MGTSSDPYMQPDDNRSSAARAEIGAGKAAYWQQLEAHGIPVIAISPPSFPGNLTACMAEHQRQLAHCAAPRSSVLLPDPPTTYAARDLGGTVPLIDMSSLLCEPQQCDPVVGNVRVYLDFHHLTDAYSKTMAPYLDTRLRSAAPALFAPAQA